MKIKINIGIHLPEDYKPSFRNSLPLHSYDNWSEEDIYKHQRRMINLKLKYLENYKRQQLEKKDSDRDER